MTRTVVQASDKKNVCYFSSGLFAGVPEPRLQWFTKSSDGSGDSKALYMTGVPIFRSGTFADSMGFVQTWEPEHIHQMAMNYGILASRGIFSDVPVRKGHPNPFTNQMDEVIGYIKSLSVGTFENPVESEVRTYLLADYEVLDETAAQKISTKLWRNRSSEIGMYVTNNEAEFYPVLTGFAYVDIPAVEGLNFSKIPGVNKDFTVILDTGNTKQEEAQVADENTGASGTHSAPPAPPAPPAVTPPAVTPPAPQQSFSFSFADGRQVSDFAAVQAAITAMETELTTLRAFETETQKAARSAFIDKLVSDNKILAPQAEGLKEFAISLDNDQWNQYRSSYEAAPSLPLLGNHSDTASAQGVHQQTAETKATQEVATAERLWERLKLSGMTPDQLKQTNPYKTLVSAGKTPTF